MQEQKSCEPVFFVVWVEFTLDGIRGLASVRGSFSRRQPGSDRRKYHEEDLSAVKAHT